MKAKYKKRKIKVDPVYEIRKQLMLLNKIPFRKNHGILEPINMRNSLLFIQQPEYYDEAS